MQRKALIDRFREDDHCRAFLSTDAGGVGLNLQHASVVVNMDLPWNPAVLEQRIGRVHRLGQRQPVQVTNFIAQGTIEEGMLSVLKFKKSLFAGVLDGGEREVFLGGTRPTRFMETVEKATAAAGGAGEAPATPRRAAEPRVDTRRGAGQPASAPAKVPAAAPPADPWAALLQSGVALLGQLATAGSRKAADRSDGLTSVRRDPDTGEDYVRIPLPSADVLNQALDAIKALLVQFGN